MIARCRGVVGEERVPVVALVGRRRRDRPGRTASSTRGGAGRTASAGTSRPARGRRRRRRGRSRAGRGSTRPGCAPGPLPTTTTWYVARREGPLVCRGAAVAGLAQLRHRFAFRRRRACAWSIRYMSGGLSWRTPFTAEPARTRRPERPRRDDVGAGRLAEQDRDLAEEVAPGERRPLLAVDHDLGLAVEDDVERRPGQALAEDAGALREDLLLEHVGDPLELRAWSGRRTARSRRSGRRSRRGWPWAQVLCRVRSAHSDTARRSCVAARRRG